jgi:hypothetical protein
MAGAVAFGRSIQLVSKKSLKMSGIQLLLCLTGNMVLVSYNLSLTFFLLNRPVNEARSPEE